MWDAPWTNRFEQAGQSIEAACGPGIWSFSKPAGLSVMWGSTWATVDFSTLRFPKVSRFQILERSTGLPDIGRLEECTELSDIPAHFELELRAEYGSRSCLNEEERL